MNFFLNSNNTYDSNEYNENFNKILLQISQEKSALKSSALDIDTSTIDSHGKIFEFCPDAPNNILLKFSILSEELSASERSFSVTHQFEDFRNISTQFYENNREIYKRLKIVYGNKTKGLTDNHMSRQENDLKPAKPRETFDLGNKIPLNSGCILYVKEFATIKEKILIKLKRILKESGQYAYLNSANNCDTTIFPYGGLKEHKYNQQNPFIQQEKAIRNSKIYQKFYIINQDTIELIRNNHPKIRNFDFICEQISLLNCMQFYVFFQGIRSLERIKISNQSISNSNNESIRKIHLPCDEKILDDGRKIVCDMSDNNIVKNDTLLEDIRAGFIKFNLNFNKKEREQYISEDVFIIIDDETAEFFISFKKSTT